MSSSIAIALFDVPGLTRARISRWRGARLLVGGNAHVGVVLGNTFQSCNILADRGTGFLVKRLAVIAAAMILISASATVGSDGAPGTCPPVVEYSRAELKRVAQEVRAL